MSAKVDVPNESDSSKSLDIVKLVVAGVLAIGSAVAFYWFADQWPTWARVLMVLAGVGIGAAVGLSSGPGILFRKFLRDAQIEVRKVVWPTRQETWQTTLIVAVAVLIIGIMIWVIDVILSWAVRLMMG
ncbi:MAG: preprotein translocase subunit SecE [Rhodanobacteraceae bacterium]|nr:preprotein translocase subunit SecE [Rhodanobacteraceae bacterium]